MVHTVSVDLISLSRWSLEGVSFCYVWFQMSYSWVIVSHNLKPSLAHSVLHKDCDRSYFLGWYPEQKGYPACGHFRSGVVLGPGRPGPTCRTKWSSLLGRSKVHVGPFANIILLILELLQFANRISVWIRHLRCTSGHMSIQTEVRFQLWERSFYYDFLYHLTFYAFFSSDLRD